MTKRYRPRCPACGEISTLGRTHVPGGAPCSAIAAEKARDVSLTFAQVKATLTQNGMTITKDTVGSGPTGSGEYRVTFSLAKDAWPGLTKKAAKDAAYYTSDLDDALRTGKDMSRSNAWRHSYLGKP